MVVFIPKRKIVILAQDELGKTIWNGQKVSMQKAFDEVYLYLKENHANEEYIWNVKMMKQWGKVAASEKQVSMIKRFMKDFDTENLNKMQATQILNRLFYR